jgi:hypothetical protein
MTLSRRSVLLLGETGVGKTHFGAQLLRRLVKGDGALRMNGAATNLEPFESALDRLSEGRAADHTATSIYADSVWPVADANGLMTDLIWPDYGGEQVKTMISSRRIPSTWRERVKSAPAWLLMIRLQQTRLAEDIFSRPLLDLKGARAEPGDVKPSDQARLIELLQMLLFIGAGGERRPLIRPQLCLLLTCWDELGATETPAEVLAARLPMLSAFIHSNYGAPMIVGLSALERPLNSSQRDMGYVTKGPEHFGFVVMPDGKRSSDLTLPLHRLITAEV